MRIQIIETPLLFLVFGNRGSATCIKTYFESNAYEGCWAIISIFPSYNCPIVGMLYRQILPLPYATYNNSQTQYIFFHLLLLFHIFDILIWETFFFSSLTFSPNSFELYIIARGRVSIMVVCVIQDMPQISN